MKFASLVVLLALIQYLVFTVRVGAARAKYKVEAPACSGDERWERSFRVQQNTLEQLIVFIPACFAFAHFLSDTWVLLPGFVFILGRFLYAREYVSNPKTRVPGMGLTLLANAALLIGALAGILPKLF